MCSLKGRSLLSDAFATTGLEARIAPDAQISQFQVLGERATGTNLIKRLLGRNTGLKPTEALGWKHAFATQTPVPRDLAVIVTLRRADDWALSLHAKPWHTRPSLQALPFDDFIRAPFDTIADRPRYFQNLGSDFATGEPLHADRDPSTGEVMANIFELRQAKLRAWLGYLARDCSVVFLRMEKAQSDPEGTVTSLRAALGLPVATAPFRPVVKRLGSKFKPADGIQRPPTPAEMPEVSRTFMNDTLDLSFEAALGYQYD